MSRAQLLELGLGYRAIDHRIACGRLHPVHRGVFAVGHRLLSRPGAWMAAVLAAGPGAVLSHHSAATLWGIRDSQRRLVDVSAPRQCRRPGICGRHVALPGDEVTVEQGIPVTTAARTLLDLAAVLTEDRLERAVDRAEIVRLGSPTSLDDLLARYPRRPGTAALRRILECHRIGETRTRSDLEDRFLALLGAERLPRPLTNVVLHVAGDPEVDFHWPTQRLVVELDGWETHATRAAFERDRARDAALQAAGWRVVRITWRRTLDEPRAVAAQLRSLLGLGSS